MLVKYIGRPDQIITIYNGKRYVFSKNYPIVDIPVEVFQYIQRDKYHGDMIMPHYPDSKEEIKEQVQEDHIENTIFKKKAGRPKKER